MLKVYTLPSCGMCNVLKEKMNKKRLKFQEITDEKIIKEKKILSVPVLEFSDESRLVGTEAIYWVNEQN